MGYQSRTSRHVRAEFVVVLCLSGLSPGILRYSFLISKFQLDSESKSLVKQTRFIYFKVISCGKTKFIAWTGVITHYCYIFLIPHPRSFPPSTLHNMLILKKSCTYSLRSPSLWSKIPWGRLLSWLSLKYLQHNRTVNLRLSYFSKCWSTSQFRTLVGWRDLLQAICILNTVSIISIVSIAWLYTISIVSIVTL